MHLAAQPGGWHALPRDVARWWRQRDELAVVAAGNGDWRIAGDADYPATVAFASARNGAIVLDSGGA